MSAEDDTPPAVRSSKTDEAGALIELLSSSRDRAAFAELFSMVAPRLKAFGLKGGASEPLAEELVQETMIAVWRHAERYDIRRAPGMAWIYAIARNKRIDLYRKERRPEIDPEDPLIKQDPVESGEDVIARESAAVHLHQHLDDLPVDQAEVIRRAFIEDKAHSAIASELNIPLGTVKSRIRLGLARLRTALRDLEE